MDNSCRGIQEKPYNGSHILLMVMVFYISSLLSIINLPIKNEQNLPSGFRDRPIATVATTWQPCSE